MNQAELQTAIVLHQKAFAFLVECRNSGHAGSRPFDEDTVTAWQHADTCADWVTKHYSELPVAHRPDRADIKTFSHFLCSFFATSFSVTRVKRWDGNGYVVQVQALPSRRLDGSKKSPRAKSRERSAADTLCRFSLDALAAEVGIELAEETRQRIFNEPALTADLNLWAYAEQLVNRATYASQGPAVYHLWLAIPEDTRRHFSASLVWEARQRLIQRLQSLHKETHV